MGYKAGSPHWVGLRANARGPTGPATRAQWPAAAPMRTSLGLRRRPGPGSGSRPPAEFEAAYDTREGAVPARVIPSPGNTPPGLITGRPVGSAGTPIAGPRFPW